MTHIIVILTFLTVQNQPMAKYSYQYYVLRVRLSRLLVGFRTHFKSLHFLLLLLLLRISSLKLAPLRTSCASTFLNLAGAPATMLISCPIIFCIECLLYCKRYSVPLTVRLRLYYIWGGVTPRAINLRWGNDAPCVPLHCIRGFYPPNLDTKLGAFPLFSS